MSMYEFVDTTEAPKADNLPAEALQFNGQWIEHVIDGYRTLHVTGRELLESEIDEYQVGKSDGSRYKGKRYPARTITVTYQLIAQSDTAFRNAYNRLNALLDAEEAEMIFHDEPDKFFIGTKQGNTAVPTGTNKVVGEIDFYCSDPFKYSVEEKVAVPTLDNENTIAVTYNGTQKSFPTLIANVKSELGYIAYFNEDRKILQIGDPEEADKTIVNDKSETLINYYFSGYKDSDWTLNNAVPVDAARPWSQAGSLKEFAYSGHQLVRPGGYGDNNGGWHGPCITKKIPADSSGHVGAKNFTFQWKCLFPQVSTINMMGDVELLVTAKDASGNRYNLAGVAFFKLNPDTVIGLYKRGKTLREIRKAFGQRSVIFSSGSIQKYGEKLIFNIDGVKYTYTDSSLKNVEAVEIGVCFAQLLQYPLFVTGIEWLRFTSHSVGRWVDIPNKLSKGDVVETDCGGANIVLNDVLTPELGALGNDWEDFCLKPGANQISFAWSNWGTKPDVLMKYREVFL